VQVGVTGYCFAADCILSFEAVKRRVKRVDDWLVRVCALRLMRVHACRRGAR
jgi:hypothetical protein